MGKDVRNEDVNGTPKSIKYSSSLHLLSILLCQSWFEYFLCVILNSYD